MIGDAPLIELAARLREAERARTAIEPLTAEHPSISMREAYEIQTTNFEARREPKIGYKLGFTSEAMRLQMGISSPNYGHLSAGMMAPDGRVKLSELIHPRIEPEVALFVDEDLSGNETTAEEVRSAVGRLCAAIEVVDSRFVGYRFRLEDNTADNSSAARFVLGESAFPDDAPEPRHTEVSMYEAGEKFASGVGENAMGDPLEAVAWLVRTLSAEGRGIEAGSVVLTGGLTQAYPVTRPGTFAVEFSGLERVEATFY